MASSDPLLPLIPPSPSLYIHVPFCRSKCRYCDFHSVAGSDASLQAAVVEETLRQLSFFLPDASVVPRTVYVGGGTPSILARDLLERLLSGVPSGGCPEWTVEANPESLDGSFLDTVARAGVTRISMGIQSLHDERLRLLGRPAMGRECLRGLDLLEENWRGEWSCDLISGIPGQEPEELASDLHEILGFEPGHVSLYSLTVEEGTELERLVHSGRLRTNPAEKDEELWFLGKELLESAGYERYEVSNFSLPGRRCLHNMAYWNLEPYLGLGPGAVSTLPGPGGRVLRVTQTRDFSEFLKGRDALWGMEVEEVSPKDFLMETLLMGLRLRDGIPRKGFAGRFGLSFEDAFPGLLSEWIRQGWAMEDPVFLRLTESGGLRLNRLLSRLRESLEKAAAGIRLRWPLTSDFPV